MKECWFVGETPCPAEKYIISTDEQLRELFSDYLKNSGRSPVSISVEYI